MKPTSFEAIGQEVVQRSTGRKGYICANNWTPGSAEVHFYDINRGMTVPESDLLIVLTEGSSESSPSSPSPYATGRANRAHLRLVK